MINRLILLVCFSTLIYQTLCCQPSPTTSQQVRTIVADPLNPRLISVNPSQIPLVQAAPVQSIFELLKIPMPTLSSLLSVTTIAPSNETEGFESTNSTASLSVKNSTNPELDTELINGTESSGDLVREVARAEQSLTSSFGKKQLSSVTTVRPALKLFAAPMKEDSKCEMSTITAVTIMPYDDRLVGVDLDKIHEQLKLLEQFTQKTLSSFGEFSEEVTSIDGKFALRINIKHLKESTNCIEMRQYSTKAVSYSREIERILFTCSCEPMWVIAKRKPEKNT